MGLRARTLQSRDGFTLTEAIATCAILTILLGSILVAMTGTQRAFVDNQILSHIQLRAQHAMSRVVALASQALTSDSFFSTLKPTTGVGAHCLRFRQVLYIDTTTGVVTYDNVAPVYIYGPDNTSSKSSGLIIGRGATLSAIHSAGAGSDAWLGTADDDTNALINGVPVVELLIPDAFTPQAGDMFSVDVSPAPIGRLVTFTIRLNARDQTGNFLLPNDLVLSESVALRQ